MSHHCLKQFNATRYWVLFHICVLWFRIYNIMYCHMQAIPSCQSCTLGDGINLTRCCYKYITATAGPIPGRMHEWRQLSGCRDGTLKNHAPNQMGMIPQYLHTIPISCFVNYTYVLTVSLSTTTKLMKMALSTAHSSAFHIKRQSIYLPCSAVIKFQGITYIHSNIPYMQTCTAHALHSFCIQNGSYLPCSVNTTIQFQTS